MDKLAIFDVDFTLTKKETLMQFYKFIVKKDIRNIRYLPRVIFSGAMFVMNIYDEKKTKEVYLKFLDGISKEELDKLSRQFYEEHMSKLLYGDGIETIKKMKDSGYKVILISASPEFYIKEFASIEGVDLTFGTKFIIKDNKFSCKMEGNNCKGEEKVRILKGYFEEENINVDYDNSFMFSDSLSDSPLLDLVGNPYLINYKKPTKYKILFWT